MLEAIDRLAAGFGRIAGWLYVATGAMIVWEVVARYVFVAPTIWAEELSRAALVWGTFLPMAVLLHLRAHIRITLLSERLTGGGRRVAEALTLVFVLAFSAIVVWYGWDIAYDSYRVGRTSGTMMDLPNWWTEAVIPVSFGLLGLQALVELAKLGRGDPLPGGHEPATRRPIS